MRSALPPSYVNTPVRVAYAEVDDALIVTMTRILGPCWAHDYERTPALTPDEVSDLIGRPRSTLYRHLKQLRELQWLRIDQAGRRIVIRPLVVRDFRSARETPSTGGPPDEPASNEALLQALAEIGVENPKRSQLACRDIDPLRVRAWHLWAQHPHRKSLTNPVGNIILKLESGEPPPDEFLRAAEELTRARAWMQEQGLNQGQQPETVSRPEPDQDPVFDAARRLWSNCLSELQLQMTRDTFDTWLRGSHVIEASTSNLTIAVRHVYAVDWLQNRLLPVIERTSGTTRRPQCPDHLRRCCVICAISRQASDRPFGKPGGRPWRLMRFLALNCVGPSEPRQAPAPGPASRILPKGRSSCSVSRMRRNGWR